MSLTPFVDLMACGRDIDQLPTANLSCSMATVKRVSFPVDWLLSVRTSRYLLGAVGVPSVVTPLSNWVEALWLSVATSVHGPKSTSPV